MTPDTDVLLLVFSIRFGRLSWLEPVYCSLRGPMLPALSLEDRYDRITTLLSSDCPYDVPNLHSQSHCTYESAHTSKGSF